MMKIDRETCPPGKVRLLVRHGYRPGLIECSVVEWSPGGRICLGHGGTTEWYGADELGRRVEEILPADPAVPTLPGPWLEAWPSEIPDGSVWLFKARVWSDTHRFVALNGKLGNPGMNIWFGAAEFCNGNGDVLRRVG